MRSAAFDYIDWLGPGLMAAMAMQTATFESTYPIMNKIMWGRNYEAMLSTPLRSATSCSASWHGRPSGSAHWRPSSSSCSLSSAFRSSPLAVLSIPFTILIGLAFAPA